VFDSYTDIVNACCDAWNALIGVPDRITSITTPEWTQVKIQGGRYQT